MRLVALAALAIAASFVPAAAEAQQVAISLSPGEVLLKVEANGSHVSPPDVMRMTVGAVTIGRTAREATNANNMVAARLAAAARSLGVEGRDVQTSSLSVEPQMDDEKADREGRAPRITGYVARNTLELRIRDLARAPEMIDALFEAGANSVRGPTFSLSDPRPAEREARRKAVAAAREQAETYADALGMRIVRVLQLSEASETAFMGSNSLNNAGVFGPSVESGVLQTRITVNVDYAMVPR